MQGRFPWALTFTQGCYTDSVSTEGLGRGGWGGADWMLLKELSMAGTVLVQIWTDISLPTRPPEGCHRLPSAAAYLFTHGWFVHQLLIMFQIEEKSLAKPQLQRFWLKGRLMVKSYCIFVIELKAVIIYNSLLSIHHPLSPAYRGPHHMDSNLNTHVQTSLSLATSFWGAVRLSQASWQM